MVARIGGWSVMAVAVLLAQSARAEIVDDGVANGRFAEFVGAGETSFVTGGLSIEPGEASAAVDVYVYDFTTGATVTARGRVPFEHARITPETATLSLELGELPGLEVQVCGVVDGGYGCRVETSGRIDVSLVRSGVAQHENGTTAVDCPDGTVRRTTLTGSTAPAEAAGKILSFPFPAGTGGKLGRYHQRAVVIERPGL
jgi:hypothetical protein